MAVDGALSSPQLDLNKGGGGGGVDLSSIVILTLKIEIWPYM